MKTFFKDLLDLDTYTASEKWPSLKLVYDNLRCYPILAIFLSATFTLSKSSSIIELVAFWVLLPLIVLIFIATLAQTAMLFMTLAFGIFITFTSPPKSLKAYLKSKEQLLTIIFTIIFIVLFVVAFLTASKLFFVIAKLLTRS